MRSKLLFGTALLIGWSFLVPPALAQQSPGAPGTDQVIPEKDRSLPESQPKAGATAPGQTLSDKLDQTNGVLKPPANLDPDIHKPTPNTGTMPVIPPPGTPGSERPNLEPK